MTKAYTFKVEMIVEIFAKDEEAALAQLNEKGGYVTERTVELLSTTHLSKPSSEKDSDLSD